MKKSMLNFRRNYLLLKTFLDKILDINVKIA